MSILDKVRRWIDGESAELVLEQAARDAQVKPRSKAEEFIVKIAREVESVMQAELVPLPQGTTIIPSEYTVFLSSEDDKEWQGAKRRGLEQGLYHILAERAKEIAGRKKLETRSFVIELRIDGTLEKGEIRVQHSWEDTMNNKTGVLARPKGIPPAQLPQSPQSPVPSQPTPNAMPPTPVQANFSPTLKPPIAATSPNIGAPTSMAPFQPATPKTMRSGDLQQAVPLQGEDAEQMTAVNSRMAELYKLEIWRGGVRQNVVPVYKRELSVGRGSKSRPVDIPLSGDVEVSRRHLTLGTDGEGNYWVMNEGRNPATINNYELPSGQRVTLTAGVPLNICSYMLRIQPA